MRVPFSSVFTLIDGRIIPKTHIAIGNVTYAAGISLSPGWRIWDTGIGRITNYDLAVEHEDGIIVITGFFTSADPPELPH